MSGFCHGVIEGAWRVTYTKVLFDDAHGQQRIVAEVPVESTGAHIATSRNMIVRRFLDHPAKPEWLWMHDTDAVFEPDVLERLLIAADPVERPIVGALAFSVTTGDPERQVTLLPTLYIEDGRGFARMNTYPVGDMVRVAATGCHCVLIHRSVFEHESWDRSHPLPWFRMSVERNEEISEDIWFCRRAGEAGFPVWVDCGTRTGHVKKFIADEAWYLRQQGFRLRNRRTVLIPSRDPQRCRHAVAQIAGADVDEVIVAWNGDDLGTAAWLAGQPVTVVDTRGQGIHDMWNLAVDQGGDVVLLNDDVTYGPDFLPALFDGLRFGYAAVSGNYDGRNGPVVVDVTDICADRYDGTGGLAGFAFAVSGDWLAQTGYRFPTEARWWCGDNDLVLSALTSGWRCGIATGARCVHDHTGRTDWSGEFGEQIAADMAWFVSKWQPKVAA